MDLSNAPLATRNPTSLLPSLRRNSLSSVGSEVSSLHSVSNNVAAAAQRAAAQRAAAQRVTAEAERVAAAQRASAQRASAQRIAYEAERDAERVAAQRAAAGNAASAAAGNAASAAAGNAASAAAGNANSGSNANLENNELNVSNMNLDQMKKYVFDDGEEITDLALQKVKENFLKRFLEKDREEEGGKIDYTTISQVQEAERKLDEDISVLQKTFNEAKVNDPNATKQKGHAFMELNIKKRYVSDLKPVFDVLKSKIKASNTRSTIRPLNNRYSELSKNPNDLETKRQALVLTNAYKQYAKEIKDVVDRALTITGIENDANLKEHQTNLSIIVAALEKEDTNTSAPLLQSGVPLLNRMKKEDGPIDVTVPTKDTKGDISYSSYRMENGVFSKLNTPVKDNKVVEQKFSDAVRSSNPGTKVVKMTYKGEPLIVSLNISHPNDSKEKAKLNMESALQKEKEVIIPAFTFPETNIEEPGRNQNLTTLSNNQLNSAKQKIENEIKFVNTNTKVSAENKEKLKATIRSSRLQPIDAEISKRSTKSKGGFTSKKSKKNNKTKKSTRRSS